MAFANKIQPCDLNYLFDNNEEGLLIYNLRSFFMLKTIAILYGIVFVVGGILGFIPSATPNGLLFGVFHVNALHNVIHLLTGVIAFIVGFSGANASRTFFQVFGIIYAIVALLGFFYVDRDIIGIMANNMADTWLHVLIAVISLILGFGAKAERRR